MKAFLHKQVLILLFTTVAVSTGNAQNPIIQTIYTADPAPLLHNDTVYLYTGHDEDTSTWFTMRDWRCYSTTDMVNWTDQGSSLSLKTFSWAKKDAWAGQCIFRNGKFYWYVPMNENNKGMSIGVAVSTSATGPFTDALGKPLVHSGNGDIDPTVFIDDDGQAYLYWGNPYLKYVKLNEDMISYSGEVITVPFTEEGFGKRTGNAQRTSQYEEGPWLYKRKGLYYLLYPAGGVPEHLAYSTSSNITGPWHYRDTIMHIIRKGGAFTNHPGVIDYKGRSYLFYHNGALPGGGGFTRSVCVDEFTYNPDGSIPVISPTAGGVKPVRELNPFIRQEAETIAWEYGIETATDPVSGVYITDIDDGDYIKVRNVGFGKGARSFKASMAGSAGKIEIRLDSLTGPLIGTCEIKGNDQEEKWREYSCKISKTKGAHDIYFVFRKQHNSLLRFDWWKFN